MAITLTNLGVLANHRRDYGEARQRFEESIAWCRATGTTWLVPFNLAYLGLIAQDAGETERAAPLFAESLALCQDRGWQFPTPRCLEGLAAVAAKRLAWERAARLFEAAQAMRIAINGPMVAADRAIDDPIVADVRRGLGEAAFAAAIAAGQALAVKTAIDEALLVAATTPVAAAPPATPMATALGGLTRREVEVVRLLVDGRSDREIAAALSISHRTVHHHVGNIYAKLGVHSRAAIWRAALAADLLGGDAPPSSP